MCVYKFRSFKTYTKFGSLYFSYFIWAETGPIVGKYHKIEKWYRKIMKMYNIYVVYFEMCNLVIHHTHILTHTYTCFTVGSKCITRSRWCDQKTVREMATTIYAYIHNITHKLRFNLANNKYIYIERVTLILQSSVRTFDAVWNETLNNFHWFWYRVQLILHIMYFSMYMWKECEREREWRNDEATMICSRNGSVHIYFASEYSLAHLNNVYEVKWKCEYMNNNKNNIQPFSCDTNWQTSRTVASFSPNLCGAGALLFDIVVIILLSYFSISHELSLWHSPGIWL